MQIKLIVVVVVVVVLPCEKTMRRDYTSFVANEVTAYLQTISWNNI